MENIFGVVKVLELSQSYLATETGLLEAQLEAANKEKESWQVLGHCSAAQLHVRWPAFGCVFVMLTEPPWLPNIS